MIDALHVFVGPTLKREDRDLLPLAVFHPPVSQGDVYRLVESRPLAIGIVDGFFERVPAVWHKEILWALSEGVHVFGSASMGALRAAELAPFGMIGVGEIFSDFAVGRLEDDDEVTLLHADELHGYRHVSEPMVNIRATLNAAQETDVISGSVRDELVRYVKSLYYPDRNFESMLTWAFDSKFFVDEIKRLKEWLSNDDNLVDLKRKDACKMLAEMQRFRDTKPGPKMVPWTFQNTDAWAQVKRTMPTYVETENNSMPSTFAAVVDELKLHPTEYAAVKREAIERQLFVRLAALRNENPSELQIETSAIAFRRKNGLLDEHSTEQWLRDQLMTDTEFERLMKDQTAVDRLQKIFSGSKEAVVRDVLRYRSRYGELARRAEQKQAMEMSGRFPALAGMVNAVDEDALMKWFFQTHLNSRIPDDMDAFLQQLDIPSKELFFSLLRREYMFQQLSMERDTESHSQRL
jgi:hypothetical protein